MHQNIPSFELEQALLDDWKKEVVLQKPIKKRGATPIKKRNFDPNKISQNEWVGLGFSPHIATRIINYRNKGGQFKKKEDLLKIYGINESLVHSHMNYIVIPKQIRHKTKLVQNSISKFSKPASLKPIVVKLNTADSIQFQSIKGVGEYWSARIVKYREALGGFISKDQVYEMYGLNQELGDILIAHSELDLDTSTIQKININQDTIQLIARHPYISYKTAKAIIGYRKQHGDYMTIDGLKSIVTISDSLYQKMSPYLSIR